MGIILHELCALRVPFDGHDLRSLVKNITKAPTPELPATYSRELQLVLNHLLTRDPSIRPDADEILEMPIVADMERKMKLLEPGSEIDSEANSDVAQKPQSSVTSAATSAQYSDSAGTFSKQDKVEYYSDTHQEWLPANVLDVDSKGRILMDVKPKTWISVELQGERVRPRKPKPVSALEPKAPKRPSTAAVTRSGAARPVSANDARRSVPSSRPSGPEVAAQGKPGAGCVRNRSACKEVAMGARQRSPRWA
jgi:serine/threonine protein kinase